MHVCWKDVLHQAVTNILTFQKNYMLHLAKYTFHRFLCGPQTLSEWCCSAQCSLLVTFTQCRHNSTVYKGSKQHKHHSTYPSMCHCYEPGYCHIFAHFHLNTTFTHKTASHRRSGLTSRSHLYCTFVCVCVCIIYIYILSSIYISVFDAGKKFWRTFTIYFHVEGLTRLP